MDSVLERLVEEPDGSVVTHVRPKRRQQQRCGICCRRGPLYDQGEGRRRWRGLVVGFTRLFVEAAAPRITCPEHGVVVAHVPWARHRSRYLRTFEDQVAWLSTQCSQKACSQLMRLDWETVGRIISRVVDEAARSHDRLDGLERIGIDEISWRRGQRYLTLVIDHASGQLVWAAEGRSKEGGTELLRATRPRTLRPDQPCQQRWCRVDRVPDSNGTKNDANGVRRPTGLGRSR
jgi:transposase